MTHSTPTYDPFKFKILLSYISSEAPEAEAEPEPIIEEPQTPETQPEAPAETTEDAAEVSDDDKAELEVTDEE